MKSEGICLITINDQSREDGIHHVDVGQLYSDNYLITTRDMWDKYAHIIQAQYPNRKYGALKCLK
jgi:hypothetical protein